MGLNSTARELFSCPSFNFHADPGFGAIDGGAGQLNESNTAFDQPASDKALRAKCASVL